MLSQKDLVFIGQIRGAYWQGWLEGRGNSLRHKGVQEELKERVKRDMEDPSFMEEMERALPILKLQYLVANRADLQTNPN
jgi:hypothetical protein